MAAFTCSVFLTSHSLPSGAAAEASCLLQTWLLCASLDRPCCSARCISAREPCPPRFLHKMLQTRTKTCTFQKMLLVFRACILGGALSEVGCPWALLLLFALLCIFLCGLRPVSSAFVALMRKLELADSVSAWTENDVCGLQCLPILLVWGWLPGVKRENADFYPVHPGSSPLSP